MIIYSLLTLLLFLALSQGAPGIVSSIQPGLSQAWKSLWIWPGPGQLENGLTRGQGSGLGCFPGKSGHWQEAPSMGHGRSPRKTWGNAPAQWLQLLLLLPWLVGTPGVLIALPEGSTGAAQQCHHSDLPRDTGAPADTHTWMWQRATGSSPGHHAAQPSQDSGLSWVLPGPACLLAMGFLFILWGLMEEIPCLCNSRFLGWPQ